MAAGEEAGAAAEEFAAAADAAAGDEEEDEDEDDDEQPATVKAVSATAPDTPASRRSRVRWCVRFMVPSLRSRGSLEVDGS